MELELDYGVPAVAVHADAFARLVASVARVSGTPNARRAFVPTPVIEKSSGELRAYIEGRDPVTGRPFVQEVLEALTRPVAEADLRGVSFDRSTPRLCESDTEAGLQRLFRENRWTDFLPVVLPTEERVAAMLAGTSRARDEIVGRMRPAGHRELWEFDVEKVAVNAVMAGADPSFFPVILALAASGLSARMSSTSSPAAMAVVNGPIRDEIGMNYGLGAVGPYNHANSTIGRAYGLLSQNLQGGSVPHETFMGTLGNNFSYNSVTFAENEEASPWEPYHVQHGFRPDESTVSIFTTWGNLRTEGLRTHWEEKLQGMLSALDPFHGVIFVLDPIVARRFISLGLETKDQLAAWVHENVRIPARRYWDTYSAKTFIREDVEAGIEPYASYYEADPDELLPCFEPEKINVLVTGGSSVGQWMAFAGRRPDQRFQRDTDRSIVSIDDWR